MILGHTMETEKSCKNCRYFLQHYAKGYTRTTFIHTVDCGHCTNNNYTYNSRKKYPYVNGCELWQPIEAQIERRQKGIETVLREMAEHLEIIAAILKDNNLQ